MIKKIHVLFKFVIKNISNPELLAGIVIAVTVIAVTINTSSVIMQNYTLERNVQIAEQKVAIAQAELETQALKNNYYKSDAFLDIAVRKQLSKGSEGEKLIIVPKSVALSYVPAAAGKQAELQSGTSEAPSNYQKWLKFLSGKLN